MTQSALPRIVGIDLARSFAIFLAMTSHVLTVCHSSTFVSDASFNLLRPLLHAATPTFIVLFGSMLSIVYLPRFCDQPQEITARLISRAMQCYLLYALSVVVLYITDPEYSFFFSISTVMLLGVTPFTDILKFYAVALLASPLLLSAARRYGSAPLLAFSILVHLFFPAIERLGEEVGGKLPLPVGRLAMFLFGVGDFGLAGPSVLHGLTLVIFGMALSRWLISSEVRHLWGVLAAATALLVGVLAIAGTPAFLHDAMALRRANDPTYFVIGLASACMMACSAVLATRGPHAHEHWAKLTFFGRTSLFTFAFGNMLLYCVTVDPQTQKQALVLVVALTASIMLLSFTFDRAVSHKGSTARAVTRLRQFLDRLCANAVQRISRAWAQPHG